MGAIVQNFWANVEGGTGQDATVTITIPANTAGWAAEFDVRAVQGGTALFTKTTASGITNTPGALSSTMVATLTAANLTITPGGYYCQWRRTDSGFAYPITDTGTLYVTAANNSAYPTLTNLSEYCAHALANANPGESLAAQLLQLLTSSEEIVRKACGRQFTRGTYTEYPDSPGTRKLSLKETPVSFSGLSVYEDTSAYAGQGASDFASTTLLTQGADYHLDRSNLTTSGESRNGILHRVGVWPARWTRDGGYLSPRRTKWPGVLKVVYTGGYPLTPFSIKQAVWDLTTIGAEAAPEGRLPNSESGEGYSISRGEMEKESGRLNSVRAIVGEYRRGDLLMVGV
jgi:hypothetical protein